MKTLDNKETHSSVYEVFQQRGFIDRATDETILPKLLKERVTCYIGFDPTAMSFHVGNLVPIMALAHMQKHGHQPIALVGGGTGLVGDPSGKNEMRQILTKEVLRQNAEAQKKQFSNFIDFKKDRALLLNNADWLTKLNYIDFLREIGVHFSVNRMLAAESVKIRLETGLSFIEFNYQVLQAYDFWHLFKQYNCLIQMGGSDQWGNIVAGIDLIRRLEGKQAYGMTFPLIMTADGKKMGKTEKGAVWLNPQLTSPYEYYQFWINTDDRDVKRFLSLFTFLPIEEIEELGRLQGADLRKAKETLAFEATKIVHGEEESLKAKNASRALFGKEDTDPDAIPTKEIKQILFDQGMPIFKLLQTSSLCASSSEARRLIEQGGAYINDKKVDNIDTLVKLEDFDGKGTLLLRAGKKKFSRIKIKID